MSRNMSSPADPRRKKFHSSKDMSPALRIISIHSMKENTSLSFSKRPLKNRNSKLCRLTYACYLVMFSILISLCVSFVVIAIGNISTLEFSLSKKYQREIIDVNTNFMCGKSKTRTFPKDE